MQTDTASNGVEAIQMAQARKNNPYKLILMDIMMPIMDGLEATRQIRCQFDQEYAECMIIGLSAFS